MAHYILRFVMASVALLLGVSCAGSQTESYPNLEMATVTSVPSTPTPTATEVVSELRGFTFPIEGGCLPVGDQLMPNAPREYRDGVHEGVDLYGVDNCVSIARGTPVVAAQGGRVIRADTDYQDVTWDELEKNNENPRSEEALDSFRGRQVWIDHGSGVITRYCHLDALAPGITAGMIIEEGAVIAFVGESGTPESLTAPGSEHHLHFEVRIGDAFLGKDLPPGEVRALYQTMFSQ